MEKKELIYLLNKNLMDEHSAILRYLVHGYQEGEDTPIGANLLSRSREEMWHMHWLGLIIARLGGEPDMRPAPYPFDPTNRGTIIQSYIDYEEKLVPHYDRQAAQIDDPHIKRVLEREGWESSMHAGKFRRLLGKMSPALAEGQPGGENGVSAQLIERLQKEVSSKYLEMLQHTRSSWVFQNEGDTGWMLMDQAMEKMKQLAHFAEFAAENGAVPRFEPSGIAAVRDVSEALEKALADVSAAQERHAELRRFDEVESHAGLVINLDLTLGQEEFERGELNDRILKGKNSGHR